MREPLFTGSGVAIVTPFTNETVNFAALGRLLDFQLQNGTDAVIVCGTTGEATTMSYHERMRTIEFCVERVDGRVPVIAGSGSNATETAVTLSRDAERAGADGLLVVTPYYNKASQKGLIRHYTAIADAVDRPVILYDVPSRTGVTIAPETYAELAKHPNINGVKEAGGNFSNIQKTRNLCPADFSIWSGNDDETAAICMLGGRGVISVVANVLPAQMHRLTELCLLTGAGYGEICAIANLPLRLEVISELARSLLGARLKEVLVTGIRVPNPHGHTGGSGKTNPNWPWLAAWTAMPWLAITTLVLHAKGILPTARRKRGKNTMKRKEEHGKHHA